MKNLLTRSLSSLFIVAIIIGALLYNSLSNYILFLVILILGLKEFYSFVKAAGYTPNKIMGIVIAVIIIPPLILWHLNYCLSQFLYGQFHFFQFS